MKKTVYVHIGLPKTGSTYLQSALYNNREALEGNLLYLQTGIIPGSDSGHHVLAMALQTGRLADFPTIEDEQDANYQWHLAVDEIENCSSPKAMISSELFAFDFQNEGLIKKVKDKLANFDVKILFLTRDPLQFAESFYKQQILEGSARTVDDYIEWVGDKFNWETTARRWINVFGQDNFYTFAMESLKGKDMPDKFLLNLGIKARLDYSKVAWNFSLDAEATRFLYHLNKNNISYQQRLELLKAMRVIYNGSSISSSEKVFNDYNIKRILELSKND